MAGKSLVLTLVSALTLLAAGCAGEDSGEERADLLLVGGKADVPSWLKHIAVDWGCQQTLAGKFKGSDSAHLYSFAGQIGYQYTFSFAASYPAYKGAAVAVYDSETGQRVAFERAWPGNQVSVSYQAQKSIKYLIAVYSIVVKATGSYTLSAACQLLVAPLARVSVDRPGYLSGEPINATVANLGGESLFLGGCSVFAWQKRVSGAWVDQGPDKTCVREGLAKELSAGSSLSEELAAKGEGTWRLVVGYATGCSPAQPLSSAGCQADLVAYSDPLVVKACMMLSLPNPSSFCPDGKIVARYDAEGLCVAGYGCLPCEVADCGPAMGMPNTVCPDGKTVAGPTGECLANGWGGCEWQVLSCPASTCKPSGCSGQIRRTRTWSPPATTSPGTPAWPSPSAGPSAKTAAAPGSRRRTTSPAWPATARRRSPPPSVRSPG